MKPRTAALCILLFIVISLSMTFLGNCECRLQMNSKPKHPPLTPPESLSKPRGSTQ